MSPPWYNAPALLALHGPNSYCTRWYSARDSVRTGHAVASERQWRERQGQGQGQGQGEGERDREAKGLMERGRQAGRQGQTHRGREGGSRGYLKVAFENALEHRLP
eukprot:388889-Rhodomonas_salina.3